MAVKQPSSIPFRETELFLRGRFGEKLVAYYLQQDGCYVIASYDFAGEDGEKSPRLQGFSAQCVIPDLDVSKAGTRFWAEVKTKNSASFTQITQQYEHGIPLRHYNDYLEVQRITGCDVYLFIYEEAAREILFIKLDNVADVCRSYDGKKMSTGGMIFFPRNAMKAWKGVSQDTINYISRQML